jgi:hypothetical protein
MHTETGRVISKADFAALREDERADYAPLPKRLSRAAQRLLDRGEHYPTPADPELLAHAAKLRKKRQRLEKAGRKAARRGNR